MKLIQLSLILGTLLSSVLALGAPEFPGPDSGLINIRTKCDQNKIVVFSLSPLADELPVAALDWKPMANEIQPYYVQPDENNNVRLEACEQADGTYLLAGLHHRLLLQKPGEDNQINVNKTYDALYYDYDATGFTDALFGDVENFRLFMVNTMDGTGMKIKGWKAGDQTFVTVSSISKSGGSYGNLVPTVLIGTLTMRDPFPISSGVNCGSGRIWPFADKYLLGTAVIELRGCAMQGAGQTAIKMLVEAAVKDKNQNLPKDLQNKEFIVKDSGQSKLTGYDSTHHNWCDSFFVKVPELNGTYIKTGRAVKEFPLVNGAPFAGTAVQYGETWTIFNVIEKDSGPCY